MADSPQPSDILIPLVCPRCGGEIQLTRPQFDLSFILTKDKKVRFIGTDPETEGAHCLHCHTKFARKTDFDPKPEFDLTHLAEGPSKFTVVIGANQGTVVIGDGNIVTQHFH